VEDIRTNRNTNDAEGRLEITLCCGTEPTLRSRHNETNGGATLMMMVMMMMMMMVIIMMMWW
jgi:hypothetical protein